MAFLVSYTFLPKQFIIQTRSLLGFIRATIFSLLSFLGFSHFLHSEPKFQENLTQIPVDSPPASAVLIRELLPVIKFSELPASGSGHQQSCPICLYEFEGDEDVNCLVNCKHVFHKGCLDPWLDDDRRICPVCRNHLVPRELQKEFAQRLWEAFVNGEDIYCG